MTKRHFDSIVIGAGSAGLAFATTAAGHGAHVALVERAKLGGTRVNRGCVPKKILWAAGQMQRRVAGAAASGITSDPVVDFAELVRARDKKIAQIRDSYQEKLADAGITLLRGAAEVVSETCVRVGEDHMTAHFIVLATGAKPAALDIDGSEHSSDSADVLSWEALPARMVIVGGGYIGCEFAAIFNAFGVEVTLVHDGAQVLDAFDAPLATHVQAGLERTGVTVLTRDAVTQVT